MFRCAYGSKCVFLCVLVLMYKYMHTYVSMYLSLLLFPLWILSPGRQRLYLTHILHDPITILRDYSSLYLLLTVTSF